MPVNVAAARMTPGDWMSLIGLSLLWGGSFFFVQLAIGHLPAFSIVFLRVSLAAAVLALVLACPGGDGADQ